MDRYKCAYCDATFELDTEDEHVKTTEKTKEHEECFQKPSDFHDEFRVHVLAMHSGQPILRLKVSG